MFFQLLFIQFLVFPTWIETVQVGSINDMILLSSAAIVMPMNGSCMNCICSMLLATNIASVSCTQNQTCLLFHNYSIPYIVNNVLNSSFHFLILPPEQEYSTYEAIQTTQMTLTTTLNNNNLLTCSNMTVLVNYDMPGNDIANNSPETFSECCTWCLSTSGCLGFVWGWPNNTNSFQISRCWLKGSLVAPSTLAQFTAAHF